MRLAAVAQSALPVLLTALVWSPARVQAAESIGGYQLVTEVRITRTISEYTYRATLTNTGGALAGARATATSLAPDTVIVDGALSFEPVPAGGSVLSTDTFSFRQNRLVP